MKVLMVCLGNICRSPLAEGILKVKAIEKGLAIEVDSAGTSSNHVGETPDPRSIAIAKTNNIDISKQRARQFSTNDFTVFDHILVMDQSNYNNVLKLTANKQEADKVKMILNYNSEGSNKAVPDPYYGGEDGFKNVFELLDHALNNFIIKEFNG